MATAHDAAGPRRLGQLTPVETALLVCDVQERFRPIISGFAAVVDTSRRMVRAQQHLLLPPPRLARRPAPRHPIPLPLLHRPAPRPRWTSPSS